MSDGDPGAGNLCGVEFLTQKGFKKHLRKKLCLYSKLCFCAYD